MPSDWQSDEYGQPPPSLDPYQDPEGEQYDATPRGSSSMLVPDMHQLSLDDYDYTQPPGNYHHGFPDQGTYHVKNALSCPCHHCLVGRQLRSI